MNNIVFEFGSVLLVFSFQLYKLFVSVSPITKVPFCDTKYSDFLTKYVKFVAQKWSQLLKKLEQWSLTRVFETALD